MKRFKKILKELWLERHEILHLLAYALTIAWYGYVMRIILRSGIGTFLIILMLVVGLALGLFSCISLHNAFSKEDK
jgi:hypothetical protein